MVGQQKSDGEYFVLYFHCCFLSLHLLTHSARQAFAKVFNQTPDDLDMHLIYDVSHNIAKVEEHIVDGKQKTLLVHRKGKLT